MDIQIPSLEYLSQAAQAVVPFLKNYRVIAFYGLMGVGKTTFINALCKELGVTDNMNSPTFSIINQYDVKGGTPIYHFDFYRINRIEEAFDFGYEDYFYSGNYCFIEWPEKIESILPPDTLKIYLSEQKDGSRLITFEQK
jgi:tRNA threonylcarbamoyladenosine biosynthesis protein TsaE